MVSKMRTVRVTLLILSALVASTLAAAAQGRPSPSVDAAFGWFGFADDGIVSEAAGGGALRWYVSPRVSVGPELIVIRGSNHSHVVATANATFDVRPSAGSAGWTPFLVVGGGIFQTRERFASGRYTSSEGAFTAGGGVRAPLGSRAMFGVDARVGWEAHVRVNTVVSVRLGR